METLGEARLLHPDLYELLNLRAATYEKTGQLGEAAKEAKRMIKLDREGAAGYLRAGKVMCLMGKWEVALEVCRSGVGRVPQEDPQRSVSILYYCYYHQEIIWCCNSCFMHGLTLGALAAGFGGAL